MRIGLGVWEGLRWRSRGVGGRGVGRGIRGVYWGVYGGGFPGEGGR